MNAIAKQLRAIPVICLRRAGGAVREHLVHLTMIAVIGSSWLIAGSQSVGTGSHRVVFPPLDGGELAQLLKERESNKMILQSISSTSYED